MHACWFGWQSPGQDGTPPLLRPDDSRWTANIHTPWPQIPKRLWCSPHVPCPGPPAGRLGWTARQTRLQIPKQLRCSPHAPCPSRRPPPRVSSGTPQHHFSPAGGNVLVFISAGPLPSRPSPAYPVASACSYPVVNQCLASPSSYPVTRSLPAFFLRHKCIHYPVMRPTRPTSPSQRPPVAGIGWGRMRVTHPSLKSGRQAAYAQWIVTTRLLYHVHDRAKQSSRMQGIRPRAW
jgi:hypothetical protein